MRSKGFHSTTRSYYRGEAGVIIDYDFSRTDTFEKVRWFVEEVRCFCTFIAACSYMRTS